MMTCKNVWILSVLLGVTVVWQSAVSQEGVILTLRGVQYPNRSTINIREIGENDEALICQTNRRPCCQSLPNRVGEWYYPDGSLLTIEASGRDLYRNRGNDGEVRLNRRNNAALFPTGMYHCEVPDASSSTRSLYIALVDFGIPITGVSYNSNASKLTCETTGGSATSLYGECINEGQCRNSSYYHIKVTVNPERTTLNNTLNLNKTNSTYYVCITRTEPVTYFATLLTEYEDGEVHPSQLVGRIGEQVTLLCMGDTQVQSAAWTGNTSSNITFTHLRSTNAGVYTCRGTTVNSKVVSHSVNLMVSECSAIVRIAGTSPTATIGRNYTLTCDSILWGTGCSVSAYYIYHENILKSTNSTILFRPLKLPDVGLYICTITTGGFNFTSKPTFFPLFVQLPSPELDISSSHDNPISPDTFPTLTCTIRLDPSIDRDVQISVSWNGPVYGFGEFTVTAPRLNSSAQVPTYTSTAMLNAHETFYDSGQYRCSAVISLLSNTDLIQNGSSTSESISVTYLFPHRPNLHEISQEGHNWIFLSWDHNSAQENVTNYEVKYSYIGECSGVVRRIMTERVNESTTSFNITGITGEYFNYSINLTAINNTGRSPPNIAFAATRSGAPSGRPQTLAPTLVFSTNITLQWGRVSCIHRNSEISHYILRYSLVVNGSDMDQRDVSVQGVGDEDRMHTITRLHPQSSYNVTIAAVNVNRQEGPISMITVTTVSPESVPFQIQLIGVHSCLQWRISDPEDKVYDVSEGIVEGINYHCPHCELSNDDITQGEFQCFPGSPNQVTFRGKVQDRAQATAREVIYYMEQWITSSDSVSIPVHHARLSINSTCVVLIASLDDPECPGYLRATQQMDTTTTTSSSGGTDGTLVTTSQSDQKPTTGINVNNAPSITVQSSGQVDTGAVVGGAVAIVFIIATGLVIVLVLYIILKYRQKTHNKSYTLGTPDVLQKEKEDTKTAAVEGKDQEEEEVQNYTYVEVMRASHKTHREDKQSRRQPHSKEADISNPSNVKEKKDEESYYEI